MPFLIDIPVLKKMIPCNVDDTDISRLYISASAIYDKVDVPKDLAVPFDIDNPFIGEIVSIEPCLFFTRVTSIFANMRKAESILKDIMEEPSIIGINCLTIKKSTEYKLENNSGYELYRNMMDGYGLIEKAFTESIYIELVDSILYLPLSKDSRLIYGKKYPDISGGCIKLAKLLKNKLRLSYEQQIAFVTSVNDIFARRPVKKGHKKYSPKEVEDFRNEIWQSVGFFKNYENSEKYKSKIDTAIGLMYSIGHLLSILQTLEVYSRSSVNEKDNNIRWEEVGAAVETNISSEEKTVGRYDPEELIFAPNNIAIECDIILKWLKSVLLCNDIEKRTVIFVEPSFTLIDRWYRDEELNNVNVTFVVRNESIRSVLKKYNNTDGKSKKAMVRYLSFEEFCELPVFEMGEIILCTNPGLLDLQICGLISERKKLHPDSCIVAVDFDKSFSSSSSFVAMERDYISHVIVFPIGLEDEKNGKRTIWSSENNMRRNIDVELMSRKNNKEKTTIKMVGHLSFDRNSFFPTEGKTLRSHIANLISDKGDSHTPKCSIMFSPNIRLYVSGFSEVQLAFGNSLKVYIRTQFRMKDGNGYKFVPVPESRISRRFKSVEDAKNFLNEYPFCKKDIHQQQNDSDKIEIEDDIDSPEFEDISFRRVGKFQFAKGKDTEMFVGAIVRKMMDDKRYRVRYPDEFKEFVFLFYDVIENSMDKKDINVLKKLFFDPVFSQKSLSEITPIFLQSFLSEDDYDEDFLARAFNVMKVVCDVAVTFCIMQRNEFALLKDDEEAWNKLLRRTSRGLTKKDFTETEFKKLYTYLINIVDSPCSEECAELDRAKAWCMLISLLTGLEAYIVPALKWRDVDFITPDCCTVRIVRQLTNDGAEEHGIEDEYDHRPLPFGRIITRLMKKALERIKLEALSNHKNERFVQESYIANAWNRDVDSMHCRIPPRRITEAENKILAEVLKRNECLIYVPTFAGGTKENDISIYKGNIIRENFRRYALTVCEFSDDELAYFFGNKPITTDALSYVDYRSVGMLLRINVKLNRIAALLEADGKRNNEQETQSEFIKSPNPTSLDLKFETTAPLDLVVSAQHGFHFAKEEIDADRN